MELSLLSESVMATVLPESVVLPELRLSVLPMPPVLDPFSQ